MIHIRLADAVTVIDDERRRIQTLWNECYAIAQSGRGVPVELRARLRYEGVRSIGVCIDAVLKMFEVGGGRIMQHSNPLQRHLRDILAMRNHPFGIPEPRAAAYARLLLGVRPDPFSPTDLGGAI
jgi:3-hydroxy-9,10-secoandrosta-1,3,5(10)-triene-9,17-dione monooxygenase